QLNKKIVIRLMKGNGRILAICELILGAYSRHFPNPKSSREPAKGGNKQRRWGYFVQCLCCKTNPAKSSLFSLKSGDKKNIRSLRSHDPSWDNRKSQNEHGLAI